MTALPTRQVLVIEDLCQDHDWVARNVLVLREALRQPDLAHFTRVAFTSDKPVFPSISISDC